MRDQFEKFVLENMEAFDKEKPSPAIWKELSRAPRSRVKSKKSLIFLSKIAAGIMIFILSYIFHEYHDFSQEREKSGLVDVYNQFPDLDEARDYYSYQVVRRMKEVAPYLQDNPDIAGAYEEDIMELDSMYTSLKMDLMDNIANEQIIEAMIQNYRIKLDILEGILSELKNENNQYNETSGKHL